MMTQLSGSVLIPLENGVAVQKLLSYAYSLQGAALFFSHIFSVPGFKNEVFNADESNFYARLSI